MRKTLFVAILSLAGFCSSAGADVLAVPEPAAEAVPVVKLPAKGDKMAKVVKQFGQPQVKHKAAGGDTRLHPPITRWDYDAFSVFFEHGAVVDAVLKDAPASPVAHTEELKPAQ